jgi:hypothetical protein
MVDLDVELVPAERVQNRSPRKEKFCCNLGRVYSQKKINDKRNFRRAYRASNPGFSNVNFNG